MSLLGELRDQPTLIEETPPWVFVQRALPLFIPKAVVKKVLVFSTGQVLVTGRAPMRGRGNPYFAAELCSRDTGDPRPVYVGVSRYRDEAEASLHYKPFVGAIEPQPAALVAWLAMTFLTNDELAVNHQPLRYP